MQNQTITLPIKVITKESILTELPNSIVITYPKTVIIWKLTNWDWEKLPNTVRFTFTPTNCKKKKPLNINVVPGFEHQKKVS